MKDFKATKVDINRDNFYVIVFDNTFYLGHEAYGDLLFMFAFLDERECPRDFWEDIIDANVDSYIEDYVEIFFDGDDYE